MSSLRRQMQRERRLALRQGGITRFGRAGFIIVVLVELVSLPFYLVGYALAGIWIGLRRWRQDAVILFRDPTA